MSSSQGCSFIKDRFNSNNQNQPDQQQEKQPEPIPVSPQHS